MLYYNYFFALDETWININADYQDKKISETFAENIFLSDNKCKFSGADFGQWST